MNHSLVLQTPEYQGHPTDCPASPPPVLRERKEIPFTSGDIIEEGQFGFWKSKGTTDATELK